MTSEHTYGTPPTASLAGAFLVLARSLVVTCVLDPAVDAAADDPDDPAADEARRAREVLDHIGWPGLPADGSVALDEHATELVRRAALAGLGAAAAEIDEAARAAVHEGASWHGEGPLTDLEAAVGLLDHIGWPGGALPVPARREPEGGFGDALMVLSADGRLLSATPRFCEITGFSAEEIVGTRVPLPFWHPEDREAYTAGFAARMASAGREEDLVRLRRRDGSTLLVRMTTHVVPAVGDVPATLVTLAADEREVRAARRARARIEERFRELADGLPVPMWRTNHEGRVTFANRAWTDFLGVPLPRPDQASLAERIHPDDRTMVLTAWRAALDEQRGMTIEFRVLRHDDVYRDVVLTSQPWFEDGVFLGFVGTSQDVTDRRRRRETLEENRRLVRRMAERAPTCIWTTDGSGRMTFLNAAWLALAGRPVHSEVGEGWLERVHPDDRAHVHEAFARAHREHTFLRVQARMRAGGAAGWREVLILGEPRVGDERFEGMTGTLEDLTPLVDAVHMEEALLRIARAARAEDEDGDLLAVLADEAARLAGLEAAAVLRLDEDALRVVAAHPGDGPWAVGQALWDGGPEAAARLRAGDVTGLLPADLRAGALAPVQVAERLWGGLVVAGRGERLDPSDHDRLSRFAELAGLALAAGFGDPAAVGG